MIIYTNIVINEGIINNLYRKVGKMIGEKEKIGYI